MKRTLVHELPSSIGSEVRVQGFLHTLRRLGEISFLVLRDRTGLVQVLIEDIETLQMLDGLQCGSILDIHGLLMASKYAKQGYELHHPTIIVLRSITETSPVVLSKESLKVDQATLFDQRVLTLRHPKQSAIFSLAAFIEKSLRHFLEKEGCTQINTPKLIAFPTEGGAEVFGVDYFGKSAYLAQSPQFYKQIMVPVFERVYEIGRAYRAEKSNTTRHMSEILMLDVEIGFIDDFEEMLSVAERMLRDVIDEVWIEAQRFIELLNLRKPLIPSKIPRITVDELHELYFLETGEDLRQEEDLTPGEERFISAYALEHWQSDMVFVTEFPWSDAKFYHYQNRYNLKTTERADLLFRGVEIATLTRREVDYQRLKQQMLERGVDPSHPGLQEYLKAFRYGMPESGGFGFGMARFVQKIASLANAKEAELFPRDVQRMTP